MILNIKQQKALDIIKTGKNLFLTGASGAGKSTTIKSIIEYANEHDINIATTASTGLSAFLINGSTVHSYLGIGIGRGTADEIAKKVNKNFFIANRIRKLQILIIDEISMIDSELFTKISEFLCIIKKKIKAIWRYSNGTIW